MITGKRKFWESHVAAQRRSGLSQAKYCEAQGLSHSSLGYWVTKLNRDTGAGGDGRFLPVKLSAEPIEIVVGCAIVRAPAGADSAEIRRIVEALSC